MGLHVLSLLKSLRWPQDKTLLDPILPCTVKVNTMRRRGSADLSAGSTTRELCSPGQAASPVSSLSSAALNCGQSYKVKPLYSAYVAHNAWHRSGILEALAIILLLPK